MPALAADLVRLHVGVKGVNFLANQLGGKRLGLRLELVPNVTVIAFLVNASQLESVAEYPEVEAASRQVGRKIVLVKAASEREFEPAFAAIVKACAGALVVGGSSLFTSQSGQLVALAARHSIPAIYDLRYHVAAGGLVSYGASRRTGGAEGECVFWGLTRPSHLARAMAWFDFAASSLCSERARPPLHEESTPSSDVCYRVSRILDRNER
jgi:ABC-type uncharacterized transport system substrate-binding protein